MPARKKVKPPPASSSEKSPNDTVTMDREFYRVLELECTATTEQIKRAYYKMALQYHPDRTTIGGGEGVNTTATFQLVGRAYETLSDPIRRKLYDETGIIENNSTSNDWKAYFCELFHRVTFADLDDFKVTYVGSVEEYEDILAAYVKNRGDISKIIESIFFATVDSEDRYLSIIKRAISKGIIPTFDSFEKIINDDSAFRAQQRKRKRRADGEAVEALALAKELGLNTTSGRNELISTIRDRQQGRFHSLIAGLEAKYKDKSSPSVKKQQRSSTRKK